MQPVPFSREVADITQYVFDKLGMPLPNAVNINLYSDGLQTVGWHSDNEPLFKSADVRIYSLSLGAAREFQLCRKDVLRPQGKFRRPNVANIDPKNLHTIILEDGDLLGMAGRTQEFYDHQIKTASQDTGPRINLTWRYVTAHQSGCVPCRAD